MTEYLIGGFISVSSVIQHNSRDIYKIIIDKERQSRISSASYHYPEKAQYAFLNDYIKSSSIAVEYLSAEEFASLTGGEAYGGICATVGDRRYQNINQALKGVSFALILDGIEDPFNFGYVLRTAYACGCGCVLLPERNYFTSSSIVIRSSAGASEMIPVVLYNDIDTVISALKNKGYSVIASAKTESAVRFEQAEIKSPACLVIGGEKRGINKRLLSSADTVVCIEYKNNYNMSLSASSAASILIYGISSRI